MLHTFYSSVMRLRMHREHSQRRPLCKPQPVPVLQGQMGPAVTAGLSLLAARRALQVSSEPHLAVSHGFLAP